MMHRRGRVDPGERVLITLHDGDPGRDYPGRNRVFGTRSHPVVIPQDGDIVVRWPELRLDVLDPWIVFWRQHSLEFVGAQYLSIGAVEKGTSITVRPTFVSK